MASSPDGITRFGGAALVASGALGFGRSALDLAAGFPPSDGSDILAWAASHKTLLAVTKEVFFFAAMALVPGVLALRRRFRDDTAGEVGTALLAATIPILGVLAIVQGRLVYPMFRIELRAPAVAELVVALLHGGLHAVAILLAVATLALGLAVRATRRPLAVLAFATALVDVVGSYPDRIGPLPTFACGLISAAWLVVLGTHVRAPAS